MTRTDHTIALTLPHELLLTIFAQNKHPAALFALAGVCREWKDLVDEPSLWTNVSVTSHTALSQLRAQLERSGSRSIDVLLSFSVWQISPALHELCHMLFVESGRVERMTIDMKAWDTNDIDDGDENEDEDKEWPQDVIRGLASGLTWPRLRTLDLTTNAWVGSELKVDIVAPMLETLVLAGVSVRSWAMGFGEALQDISVKRSSNVSGLFEALHSCPDLRRLTVDNSGHSSEPLHLILSGRPPLLANLVELSFLRVRLDLHDLLRVLACCPRLEQLSLEFNLFDNHDGLVDARFQLQHLEALHLTTSLDQRCSGDVLRALLPAVSTAKLHRLRLDHVNIDACETILGSSLEQLTLTRVQGNASRLISALGRCERLHTLTLRDMRLSSIETLSVDRAQRPLALRHAAIYCTPPEGTSPDRQVENQRLVLALLSLMDNAGIHHLVINGSPLQTHELVHVCNGVFGKDSVSLQLSQSSIRTRLEIMGGSQLDPFVPHALPGRTFEVDSLVDSLPTLDSTIGLVACLVDLRVNLQSAVVFLGAFAKLPSLLRLTLHLTYFDEPRAFHESLETIVASRSDVSLDCSLDCPSLGKVSLWYWNYDEPIRVSKNVVDRFLGILHSTQSVNLETTNVSVDSGVEAFV